MRLFFPGLAVFAFTLTMAAPTYLFAAGADKKNTKPSSRPKLTPEKAQSKPAAKKEENKAKPLQVAATSSKIAPARPASNRSPSNNKAVNPPVSQRPPMKSAEPNLASHRRRSASARSDFVPQRDTGADSPAAPLNPLADNFHQKKNKTPLFTGYSPSQIREAYGLDTLGAYGNFGAGQTIGIVAAHRNDTIVQELTIFSTRFGLPLPNATNFAVYPEVSQATQNQSWFDEIALDVEWTHAIAPNARIIVVLSETEDKTIFDAVAEAVNLGADVISMSWGFAEDAFAPGEVANYDNNLFSNPNVTFVASSGDLTSKSKQIKYPASSPFVLAVGGTKLLLGARGQILSETAWSGSMGGFSIWEPIPPYQIDERHRFRARMVPDIAFIGDPDYGAAFYDSNDGWAIVGGTSLSAPIAAGMVALVNAASQRANAGLALHSMLYAPRGHEYDWAYSDIHAGCSESGYCAGVGYDLVTGLGRPKLQHLIPYLSEN